MKIVILTIAIVVLCFYLIFCIPTVYLVSSTWLQRYNKYKNEDSKVGSIDALMKINQNFSHSQNKRVDTTSDIVKDNTVALNTGNKIIIKKEIVEKKEIHNANTPDKFATESTKNDEAAAVERFANDKKKYYDNVDNLYYNQLSVSRGPSNYTCIEENGRYALPGSSEEYIECKEGKAMHMQCLNGLSFDYRKANTELPCQYSVDIPFHKTSISQDKEISECPHQFGYYKIEDEHNCSSFRICEFGTGYDFKCPNGLAFRSDTLRCDWPHKVPECNAEAYADFRCPDKTPGFQFYRSPSNCQVHYVCLNGVPRRQVCEKYMAFDLVSNCCIPADRVKSCDVQLQLLASQYRRDKLRRDFHHRSYSDDEEDYKFMTKGLSFERRLYSKPKVIMYAINKNIQ